MGEYLMSESLGISVQNVCYECMVIARDTDEGFLPMQCQTCIDDAEARADDNAWNLHEDDRLGEGKCLSLDTSDAPSASEWVASETYVRTYGEKEKKPVFTEKWKEESNSIICLAVKSEFELEKLHHKLKDLTPSVIFYEPDVDQMTSICLYGSPQIRKRLQNLPLLLKNNNENETSNILY